MFLTGLRPVEIFISCGNFTQGIRHSLCLVMNRTYYEVLGCNHITKEWMQYDQYQRLLFCLSPLALTGAKVRSQHSWNGEERRLLYLPL
jgi:hypothetical protein